MNSLSMDLRERIVAAYEAGEGSHSQLSKRFVVSKSVVGKLVRQFRQLGTLEPQTHTRGRKRVVKEEQETQLEEHLQQFPDATLEDRIEALGLQCSVNAMWHAVRRLKYRYKKNSSPDRAGP